MIYSRSVEYAIRALTHLAGQPDGGQKMVREIADEEEMPVFFLAKTLQQLARKGLLHSVKGPTGGFGFGRPAREISLMDVITALDGPGAFERCIVGLAGCSERLPCPMDESFRPIRKRIIAYLTTTTIGDLAGGLARQQRSRKVSRRRKPAARKSTNRR